MLMCSKNKQIIDKYYYTNSIVLFPLNQHFCLLTFPYSCHKSWVWIKDFYMYYSLYLTSASACWWGHTSYHANLCEYINWKTQNTRPPIFVSYQVINLCLFYILTFSFSSPKPSGRFHLNFTQSITGWRELKFVQSKGHTLFKGEMFIKC